MDVPPISLEGSQDFDFSPDGTEIALIINPDEEVSLSTNNSLFVQAIDGIRAVGEYVWLDSEQILFLAADAGYRSLYGVAVSEENTAVGREGDGGAVQLTRGVYQSQLALVSAAPGQAELLVVRESASRPPELAVLALASGARLPADAPGF